MCIRDELCRTHNHVSIRLRSNNDCRKQYFFSSSFVFQYRVQPPIVVDPFTQLYCMPPKKKQTNLKYTFTPHKIIVKLGDHSRFIFRLCILGMCSLRKEKKIFICAWNEKCDEVFFEDRNHPCIRKMCTEKKRNKYTSMISLFFVYSYLHWNWLTIVW